MRAKTTSKVLLGGLLLASGAWAMGRGVPPGAEPAPMETLTGAPAESRAALGGATWDLPVTRNERVDQWIDFLAGRNAGKTRLWLERSGRYAPMIQEQLRARGMPEDLVYLAFIESGFSPKAYSRAAASGIWQFIAETGQRYGLEVSRYVDERRDPIKSTDAALTYLTELHDRFGSWYLAAAAYNTGENRVARIMREQTGRERGRDADFWLIAGRLPRETRNYVPLMLAAGHISKTPDAYGFANVELQSPLQFDTAWVPQQSSLELVARAAGVPVDQVLELNPHLLRGVTPPGRAWPVRIPEGAQPAFVSSFAVLARNERATEATRIKLASATSSSSKASKSSKATKSKGLRTHNVRRGENLSVIAKRYGMSVKRLRALNGLGQRSIIRPGQKLRVV